MLLRTAFDCTALYRHLPNNPRSPSTVRSALRPKPARADCNSQARKPGGTDAILFHRARCSVQPTPFDRAWALRTGRDGDQSNDTHPHASPIGRAPERPGQGKYATAEPLWYPARAVDLEIALARNFLEPAECLRSARACRSRSRKIRSQSRATESGAISIRSTSPNPSTVRPVRPLVDVGGAGSKE